MREELIRYFSDGVVPTDIGTSIGMEIETSLVNKNGRPITLAQSQALMQALDRKEWSPWKISVRKGDLVTEMRDREGNVLKYDLGWQNFELCTVPLSEQRIVSYAERRLRHIYKIAAGEEMYPHFSPVLDSIDDLLVVPDERDQIWIELDGREALIPIARISSVQFTIAVRSPDDAIFFLNRLGRMIGCFLEYYPQDRVWKEYIRSSRAGYHPLRYGGPLFFRDLDDYCRLLLEHKYVSGPRLVPHEEVSNFDIPLFLRSIWWYFRLRRYGANLCIEVRPLGRYGDEEFQRQLDRVLRVMRRGEI